MYKRGGLKTPFLPLSIYEPPLGTIDSLIHRSLAHRFFLVNYYAINSIAFTALQSALSLYV